jgi:hypothetical protein
MKWLIVAAVVIVAVIACIWWFCKQMDKDMEGY